MVWRKYLTTNILNSLMVSPVVVDVETTTAAKGNPFNVTNKLVLIQLKEKGDEPYVLWRDSFKQCLPVLGNSSCVIGFNLKFDLNWLEVALGYKASVVWDCQLAEFILSGQTNPYPSLEDTAVKYGLGHKQDKVKEYWDQGIDTDEIPADILEEYGKQDVSLTWQIFLKQVELFQTTHKHQFKLFRLHCNDLLVLQEMEVNGIMYDEQSSVQAAELVENQITKLENTLYEFTNGVPINYDSNFHTSSLLYGGVIKSETRVPIGVYKSGLKAGQVRNKVIKTEYQLPRLVDPLKGSELATEGYYSTDESTLLSLHANKVAKFVITKLLERTKLVKLNSTYLLGLPKTIAIHDWPMNMLHSNLNQCVATTGRLSSTKPNQQNLPKEAKRFCVSRYDN
jgi:DNA polymerase I-like protein with 3'-5' exonuclease and polymerase domains